MDGVVVLLLSVGIVWGLVGLGTTALLIFRILPTVAEIDRRQSSSGERE